MKIFKRRFLVKDQRGKIIIALHHPKNLSAKHKTSFRVSCSYLCDQIGVADDGPHKESVVCHLGAHFHARCTQVQVHLVVGTWDGSKGKIAHAVELQLESESWFQVTVDSVLLKLGAGKTRQQTKYNMKWTGFKDFKLPF